MKKIKIALMSAALLTFLFMNVNFNGNVEEMYLSPEPELALANGQCWMRLNGTACVCNMMVGPACIAICISHGQVCNDIIVEETY